MPRGRRSGAAEACAGFTLPVVCFTMLRHDTVGRRVTKVRVATAGLMLADCSTTAQDQANLRDVNRTRGRKGIGMKFAGLRQTGSVPKGRRNSRMCGSGLLAAVSSEGKDGQCGDCKVRGAQEESETGYKQADEITGESRNAPIHVIAGRLVVATWPHHNRSDEFLHCQCQPTYWR